MFPFITAFGRQAWLTQVKETGMHTLVPWIALFGPFVLAALGLLASHVLRHLPHDQPTWGDVPEPEETRQPSVPNHAWQQTFNNVRQNLRPRYPYFG